MNESHAKQKFHIGRDGCLRLLGEPSAQIGKALSVVRCFPWTDPDRFLSLRDKDGKEVAFVADPTELDPDSRRALEQARDESSFVFEIQKVLRVARDIELRVWEVETTSGRRSFQTELEMWPEALPDGGSLVRDITGDLYRLPPAATLDLASRKLLWAFMD